MTFPIFLAQAAETNATDANATDANSSVAETNATDVAEQVAEVVVEPTWLELVMQEGAVGLLLEGGFFMWPLLILAIVGMAVVIERWRSLKMLDSDGEKLRQEVIDLLSDDKPEDALYLCESERGPVAAMLSNGLRKYLVLKKLGHDQAQIEEQVVKSMENYGVHVVAALERHLPILATISSVAPMLGFLGTVQGMIVAFSDIVEKMGEVNIVEAAASGIQVALLTTCFGLIVGIPAYIFFNYFTSIINGFVLEVEGTAAELIEVVTVRLTLDRHEDESKKTKRRPTRRKTAAKVSEE
jgi:biopolymer transport protein ExbB